MFNRGLLGEPSYEIKSNHIFIICFVIVVANIAGALLVSKSTDDLPSEITKLQPIRWDYVIVHHKLGTTKATLRLFARKPLFGDEFKGPLPISGIRPSIGHTGWFDHQNLYHYYEFFSSIDDIFEMLGGEGFELVSVADTRMLDERTEEQKKEKGGFSPYGMQYIFKRPNPTNLMSHERSWWTKTIRQR